MWPGKNAEFAVQRGATTKLASPDHTLRSAETSSTVNGTTVLRSSLAGEPLGVASTSVMPPAMKNITINKSIPVSNFAGTLKNRKAALMAKQ